MRAAGDFCVCFRLNKCNFKSKINDFLDKFPQKISARGGKIKAPSSLIQKVHRSIGILISQGGTHIVTVTYIPIDPALMQFAELKLTVFM